ncbi:MAG: hypothetical protein D6718_04500 [Acidobacteria bacterium]|nr:MAG: hypothetical protein D6718_04500 [Acidobacteriota bacterium]
MRCSGHRDAKSDHRNQGEHGSGLLLTVFALALVATIGAALLFVSQIELRSGKTDLRSKRAFYVAEAGLEHGRESLRLLNIASGDASLDDELDYAAGENGQIDFDPAAVRPVFDANGGFVGLTGYGDDVPIQPITSFGGGWYATFLTNDPAEGRTTLTDGNDRVMLTSVAVLPEGSMEIVEGVVLSGNAVLPPLPAAITILGPSPTFSGGDSSAKKLTGDDCDGFGIPGLHVPVVGVLGSSSEAMAEAGVHHASTFVEGTQIGVDTVDDISGIIDPSWTDCDFLVQLAASVRQAADIVADSKHPPASYGSVGDEKIIFVDGDLKLNGSIEGAGLLWVTGKLTLDGSPKWHGPILVVGRGEVHRKGGGDILISGGNLVANVAGPDHRLWTADDCAGPDGVKNTADDGIAPGSWTVSGGGQGVTEYCTSDLESGTVRLPYPLEGFRQR